MRKTVEKYGARIQAGEINPVFQCEEETHGVVFDPASPKVPLDHMGFGRWHLAEGQTVTTATGEREYVLVPIGGRARVDAGEKDLFPLNRERGSFRTLPQASNAQALYVGRGREFTVHGPGKVLFFFAPGFSDRPVRHVAAGSVPIEHRGNLNWSREVVTLVEPGRVSDNLVVGETYSPPALWSGTPIHVHDSFNPREVESDHEEVYYFVQRYFKRRDEMDPYAVQMLFDGEQLSQAYRVRHRTAVAIPGACHPVVAGPASDLLYVWGLASDRPAKELGMRDIRDYAYLKRVGEAVQEQIEKRGITLISPEAFVRLCSEYNLAEEHEQVTLSLYLRQYGFVVGDK